MEVEPNPVDNSSDSELSDSWTILDSKCSEHDVTKTDNVNNINNSSDASDVDSIEVVENCDQEGVKHDEVDSDGISVISESDVGDHVETVPAVVEPGEKKYLHHPNDHVNSFLNLILAIAVATVFGLGVGHYLGTQKALVKPDDTAYLHVENQLLRSLIQDLHGENEWFRRILQGRRSSEGPVAELILDIPNDTCTRIENMFDGKSFFNQSLKYDVQYSNSLVYNAPSMNLLAKYYSDKDTEYNSDLLGHISSKNYSQTKGLSQTTPLVDSQSDYEEAPIILSGLTMDYITVEDVPKYSEESDMPQNKDTSEDVYKYYEQPTTETYVSGSIKKLVDDIRPTITSGSELVTDLKHTLSRLHSVFVEWNQQVSSHANSYRYKINSFGKKAFKEMEHIFQDGERTQKLLSKILGRLESFQRNFPEKCDLNKAHMYNKKWCIDEDDNVVKFMFNKFSKVSNTPQGEYKYYKSSSKVYNTYAKKEKRSLKARKSNTCYKEDNECTVDNRLNNISECETCKTKKNVAENHIIGLDSEHIAPEEVASIQDKLQSERDKSNYDSYTNNEQDMIKNDKSRTTKQNVREEKDWNRKKVNKSMEKSQNSKSKQSMEKTQNSKSKNSMEKSQNSESKKSMEKSQNSKFKKSMEKSQNLKSKKSMEKSQNSKSKKSTEKSQNSKSFQKQISQAKTHSKYEKPRKSRKDYDTSQYAKSSWNNSKGKRNDKDKFNHSFEKYVKQKHKSGMHFEKYHKFKGGSYVHPVNKRNGILDKNFRDSEVSRRKFNSETLENVQQDNNLSETTWRINDDWNKSNNISGDWLIKMNLARAKQRENNHKSDWWFERALSRKMKRDEDMEKTRWYFMRARSREHCRRQPHSDWCRIDEYQGDSTEKSNREYDWKRDQGNHEDNYHDYEHSSRSRRDWRSRHVPKRWNPTKYISQAFLSAAKFMNA